MLYVQDVAFFIDITHSLIIKAVLVCLAVSVAAKVTKLIKVR